MRIASTNGAPSRSGHIGLGLLFCIFSVHHLEAHDSHQNILVPSCRNDIVELVGDALPKLEEERRIELLSAHQKRPSGFWVSIENQRDLILAIAEDLNIRSFGELYSLRIKEIEERGGITMLRRYENDLFILFSTLFPSYRWNADRLDFKGRRISKRHLQLREAIHQSKWLHNKHYRENYRSENWRWPKHNRQMEVDFHFPNSNIVLEIQGEYHDRQDAAQKRDHLKREIIESDTRTMVLWIPSAWNGDPTELDQIIEAEMKAAKLRRR